jgi:hypothetical protein
LRISSSQSQPIGLAGQLHAAYTFWHVTQDSNCTADVQAQL